MKFKTLYSLIIVAVLAGCSNSDFKSDWTQDEIQTIAASIQQDEIVLYGTKSCPYCTEAKEWLTQNNFAFKDCDLEESTQCYDEYNQADGNGVPFFIITRNGKSQQMRDGFDSNQMLTILQGE